MNAKINERPTAIVTGASSGMGLGITRALLEHELWRCCQFADDKQIEGTKPSAELVLVTKRMKSRRVEVGRR
jgi:NAD(P)-dependent dehydrogenase (short-subunit alcohol dehydrogenase family)